MFVEFDVFVLFVLFVVFTLFVVFAVFVLFVSFVLLFVFVVFSFGFSVSLGLVCNVHVSVTLVPDEDFPFVGVQRFNCSFGSLSFFYFAFSLFL